MSPGNNKRAGRVVQFHASGVEFILWLPCGFCSDRGAEQSSASSTNKNRIQINSHDKYEDLIKLYMKQHIFILKWQYNIQIHKFNLSNFIPLSLTYHILLDSMARDGRNRMNHSWLYVFISFYIQKNKSCNAITYNLWFYPTFTFCPLNTSSCYPFAYTYEYHFSHVLCFQQRTERISNENGRNRNNMNSSWMNCLISYSFSFSFTSSSFFSSSACAYNVLSLHKDWIKSSKN